MQNSPSDEDDNCGDDGSEEDKAAKDAQGDDSSWKECEVNWRPCQDCKHYNDQSSLKFSHVFVFATYYNFVKVNCFGHPKSRAIELLHEYMFQCSAISHFCVWKWSWTECNSLSNRWRRPAVTTGDEYTVRYVEQCKGRKRLHRLGNIWSLDFPSNIQLRASPQYRHRASCATNVFRTFGLWVSESPIANSLPRRGSKAWQSLVNPAAATHRDSAAPAESRSDCSPLGSARRRPLESFARWRSRGSRCQWEDEASAPASVGSPSSSASTGELILGRSRLASSGKDLVQRAVAAPQCPRYHFLALSSWDHWTPDASWSLALQDHPVNLLGRGLAVFYYLPPHMRVGLHCSCRLSGRWSLLVQPSCDGDLSSNSWLPSQISLSWLRGWNLHSGSALVHHSRRAHSGVGDRSNAGRRHRAARSCQQGHSRDCTGSGWLTWTDECRSQTGGDRAKCLLASRIPSLQERYKMICMEEEGKHLQRQTGGNSE